MDKKQAGFGREWKYVLRLANGQEIASVISGDDSEVIDYFRAQYQDFGINPMTYSIDRIGQESTITIHPK